MKYNKKHFMKLDDNNLWDSIFRYSPEEFLNEFRNQMEWKKMIQLEIDDIIENHLKKVHDFQLSPTEKEEVKNKLFNFLINIFKDQYL